VGRVKSKALVLSALLVLPLQAATAAPIEAQTHSEYDLKAAFLYNFARFVTWPDHSGTNGNHGDGRFEICVLGTDPFGPSLDILAGKRVGTSTVVVHRSPDAQGLDSCRIVFVTRSEQGRFTELLEQLKGNAVLTVSEAEGFIESGGLINFVIRNNKIRFTINAEGARNSGLRLSSRLLRLGVPLQDGSE